MYEFRITKYDPDLRNEDGRFLKEDWSSVSDIGRTYSGAMLSPERYKAIESAYTDAVLHFLEEANVDFLNALGVENHSGADGAPQEGSQVKREDIPVVVGAMLREEFWCRLESTKAFVHVGYDYYMYLGVLDECQNSVKFAHQHGLFVESFISPYHPEIESEHNDRS
jgi:hypothetical protein